MAIELKRGKIVRQLEHEGWTCEHGGEHDKFKHPARAGRIIVPRHRTLSPGVARAIAKAAGWLDQRTGSQDDPSPKRSDQAARRPNDEEDKTP